MLHHLVSSSAIGLDVAVLCLGFVVVWHFRHRLVVAIRDLYSIGLVDRGVLLGAGIFMTTFGVATTRSWFAFLRGLRLVDDQLWQVAVIGSQFVSHLFVIVGVGYVCHIVSAQADGVDRRWAFWKWIRIMGGIWAVTGTAMFFLS